MSENVIMMGEENTSPEFVIRDFKSTDVWQMTRVIGKIGIQNLRKSIDPSLIKASIFKKPQMLGKDGEMIDLPREKWTEAQAEAEMKAEMANDEVVYTVLGLLFENIGNCEKEVNKLLADGIGVDIKEIYDMDAAVYMELITQYVTREGFRDFFTQAWNLVKKIKPSKKSSGDVMAMLTS